MSFLDLPITVQKRLSKDSNTHSARLKKLFPALINMKWDEALNILNHQDRNDYQDISNFLRDITEARNDFVHEGKDWPMEKALADKCILYLFPMMDLFVELHNKFIHEPTLVKLV